MTTDIRAKLPTAPLGVFYFTVDPSSGADGEKREFMGCDVIQVRELVLAPKSAMTRMPLTQLPVAGLVTIRDTSMPLLDLRSALGQGELPEADTLTCLVVEHRGRPIALRIAEPGSICNVTWGDVKTLDIELLNKSGSFYGLVTDPEHNTVISLLNLSAFLDRLDVNEPQQMAA
jgi:chemotaxis signal transduction protein